ncbi:hypothetical protein A2125_00190 [Candidatus Woesebacteria bacterium GWB1_43_5]|uniref:Uncharacterized protein n=1 Tax=Candidatus Woesebacteria bacterium GWB1_43_5 TaxID=1802474 RepID=A0A1F7WT72_9BACT|nr:MAG: hypothetical protein A2125_00190 [Candidatus Woesebacteria bacterium GWB1_43_5]
MSAHPVFFLFPLKLRFASLDYIPTILPFHYPFPEKTQLGSIYLLLAQPYIGMLPHKEYSKNLNKACLEVKFKSWIYEVSIPTESDMPEFYSI